MSALKICVLFSLAIYIQCSPLSYDRITKLPKIGPSDLVLGELGPNDKFLFSSQSEAFPIPGVNLTSTMVNMGSDFVNIHHVTALEYGQYPDARAKLIRGGPGHNYVSIELIPGASQGFNYTVKVYGVELEK